MIRTKTEMHGKYEVSVYEIDIDNDMRMAALQFARKIVLSNNQYHRLMPEDIRNLGDVGLQQKIEIQRTYVGKLGELVFLKLLRAKGKNINTEGMFDVFDGQNNVDSFDFITANGKTVDVKTGFRNIHSRLLINIEQFDNAPKEYYVGVKLNAQDTVSNKKLVDWNSINSAIVKGYAEYSYLCTRVNMNDFGEGMAKWLSYNHLMGIDRLINMF